MSEMSTGTAIQMQLNSWRGYSAYEIAVKNGFEGTEEAWLESLQGAPGEAAHLTVNNREAVDGNITVRATDIYVEAGLATTVAQALEKQICKDDVVESLDCTETGKVLGAAQGKTLADMAKSKAQVLTQTASLPKTSWTQSGEIYTQNATVTGVTIDGNKTSVIVTPPSNREMEEAYMDCAVRASAQGAGMVTFTCVDLPDVDLEANVMVVILGTEAASTESEASAE